MKKFEKIFFSMIAMIMMVAVGSVFTSCTNDDDDFRVPAQETQLDQALGQDSVTPMTRGISSVTYFTKPSSGFVPNSVGTLPAVCGTGQYIYGGAIKAGISKSGNNLTVLVRKQNAFETFSQAGTAYLKYAHPCGSILDSNPYFMGAEYVMLSYNIASPGVTYGAYTIYPMVKNSVSPYNRYYAEPILVHTSPYIDGVFSDGHTLGTFNGVDVICNTSSNESLNGTHQCVEFCKRYLNEIYDANLGSTDNACNWYINKSKFPDSHYLRFDNDGSASMDPHPGDVLCMSGGSGYGHVAIIMYVDGSNVFLAQQNTGKAMDGSWRQAIGGSLSYNTATKTITSPTGYTIQGWMRYNP